jgi:hypothetical protein
MNSEISKIGCWPKKKYHLNKKEILYWVSKARRYLNLPKIKIKVVPVNCSTSEMYFECEKLYIQIIQPTMDVELEGVNNIRFNTVEKVLIFAIFHELAHFFQYTYYRKWFDKYRQDKYYMNFLMKHHYKKLERYADKIALILFKELYKG